MTLRIPAKVLLHVWSYDFYDMTLSTGKQRRHMINTFKSAKLRGADKEDRLTGPKPPLWYSPNFMNLSAAPMLYSHDRTVCIIVVRFSHSHVLPV